MYGQMTAGSYCYIGPQVGEEERRRRRRRKKKKRKENSPCSMCIGADGEKRRKKET
jgi:hypothetical protein